MKPFSKTEIKILVYNKVKKGIPYEQAVREVKEEIDTMKEVREFENAKKKQKRIWIKES